jgi:3-dehydroquinate synthase
MIQVEHGTGSYPVLIEPGLLAKIGYWIAPYLETDRLILISDDHVWTALGERLSSALMEARIGLVPIIVPAGEASKSWSALIRLADRLLELGIERNDVLVAFGGGVVGDLTGFAASIVKRGCRYIQVPTTLLSQVDSSVGGKTGINVELGKNLIGSFHQPTAVFIDPSTLETLSERQIRAGYAEVVKYGLIDNPDFFAWCERFGQALINGDMDSRVHAISVSVRAKAAIVARDERETTGQRALLNLGHSFAHALEAETGFSGRLLHGEAVALGMALAFQLSARRGLCDQADATRVAAHLRACRLPIALTEIGITASGAGLAEHMRHDKKASHGRPRLILAHGIGRAFVDDKVEFDEIASFLDGELCKKAASHAAVR